MPVQHLQKEKRSDAEVHGKGQHLGHEGHPPFLSEAEARRSMTDRITEPRSTLTNTKCTKNVSSKSTFKNPDGTGNAIGGESRRGASGEA